MLKTIKNILFFYFLLFNIFTCDVQTDYNFQEPPNILVVISYFMPDSIWKVRVYKLKAVNDPRPDSLFYVKNAKVSLYADNTLQEILKYRSDGFYVSTNNNKPQYGINYKIIVEAPGFPTAYSTEEHLPDTPDIKLLGFDDTVTISDFYSDEEEIQALKNAHFYTYHIAVYNAKYLYLSGSVGSVPLYFYLPSYQRQLWQEYFFEILNINKDSVRLDFVLYSADVLPENVSYEQIADSNFCYIKVRNVSETFYKYYIPVGWQQLHFSLNFFYQPYIPYGNINGGAGIFAGIGAEKKIRVPYKPPDEDYFN